jgi:hypothetical protein
MLINICRKEKSVRKNCAVEKKQAKSDIISLWRAIAAGAKSPVFVERAVAV